MTAQPVVTESRSRAIQIAFFALALAAWWLATATHSISPLFLPGPLAIAQQIGRIAHAPTLAVDIFYTLGTFAVAYTLAVLAGLAAGYAISTRRFLTRVYEPLLASLYAIPIVVFFPTFILFFGTGPNSKIALGALYAFFPIALNTIAGFAGIDRLFLRAAHSQGATQLQMLRYIYLPGAWPVVISGLRIGFFITFASVLGGETLSSTAGMGHAIAHEADLLDGPPMYAYIVIVLAVTMVLNAALAQVEKRAGRS